MITLGVGLTTVLKRRSRGQLRCSIVTASAVSQHSVVHQGHPTWARRAALASATAFATGLTWTLDPLLALGEAADPGYGRGGSIEEAEVRRRARNLDRLQQSVLMKGQTEIPFAGMTVNGFEWDNQEEGTYVSAISDKPLFASSAKYDSGSGWPSFWEPVDKGNIVERTDPRDQASLPEERWRTEVLDKASMTHLGHVFEDGPPPSYRRYCINAAALRFVPVNAPLIDWRVTEESINEFLWSLMP